MPCWTSKKKKIETNGIIAKKGFRCLVMVRKEAYIHPQKVVFSLWNCLIFIWSWDPFKGYESFDINYKYISLFWILVIRSIDWDSSSTFKIMGLNIEKEKKRKRKERVTLKTWFQGPCKSCTRHLHVATAFKTSRLYHH